MNVECPKCKKHIQLTKQDVLCGSCNEKLSKYTLYKTKKTTGVTLTAIVMGIGAYQVSGHIEHAIGRYPMAEEYQLLDACINADISSITRHEHLAKKKLCICALDRTVREFNYEQLIENKKEILPILKKNIYQCDDAM